MPDLDAELNAAAFLDDADEVAALLAAGANPKARNAHGQTALMAAATGGSAASVKLLLAAGGDADARDLFGETAADLARQALERARRAGASSVAAHTETLALLESALGRSGA